VPPETLGAFVSEDPASEKATDAYERVSDPDVVPVVVPGAYAPPAGVPSVADSASHEDPEHVAIHTTGGVSCETYPNTPFPVASL
jgi:hypothetical protein